MDATSLITPFDTEQSVKGTHFFMIANAVVILLVLAGTITWLFIAADKKWYPYKPYTRNTGPPGTQKMTDYKGSSS